MYFEFTLFNNLTLAMMALTVAMLVLRLKGWLETNWGLVYYVLMLAYWKAFGGALNTYWLYTGLTCGFLLRFEFLAGVPLKIVRGAELVVFAYFLERGVALLMGWPW